MDTIKIKFEGKEYLLEMSWSVIGGYDTFAVLISEPDLLDIDGPLIQFLNKSGPPYKAMFQNSENTDQISLRRIIAAEIENRFLPLIRNEHSGDLYA